MADDDLQSVSKAREKELQSRFTALRHTHSRMEFLVHDFAAREASIKAREEDLNVRIKYAERLLEEVATKEGVIQQRETVVEARERAANDRNIDLNNREAGLDFLTRSTLSRLREIEDFWTLPDILEGLDTEDPDIECDSEDAESDVDEACAKTPVPGNAIPKSQAEDSAYQSKGSLTSFTPRTPPQSPIADRHVRGSVRASAGA